MPPIPVRPGPAGFDHVQTTAQWGGFWGVGGSDLLIGTDAAESFTGEAGKDFIDAAGGNDFIHAGGDDDTVLAGAGDDYVTGDDGNDWLEGGAGRDTLYAGAGNDILSGGADDGDILSGGAGADIYVYRRGDGRDFVEGFFRTDGDKLDLSDFASVLGTIDTFQELMASGRVTGTAEWGGDTIIRLTDTDILTLRWINPRDLVAEQFIFGSAPSNHAPTNILLTNATVAENKAAGTVVGTLSAIDPDAGDTVSLSLVNNAGGAFAIASDGVTLVTSKSFNFEAKKSYAITVRATDQGGLAYDKVLTIGIGNVNETPSAKADAYSVGEDASLIVPAAGGLLSNDTDPDAGNALTVIAVSGGTVSAGGHASSVTVLPDGSLSFTPGAAFTELKAGETDTVTFTYTASDAGGLTSTATATITVIGANDAPTAADDGFTVAEGTSTALAVLANDTDPDLDTLTVTGATQPIEGSLTVQPDGVTFIAGNVFNGLSAGQTATVAFDYAISDGNGGADAATATVTVEGAGTFDPGTVSKTTSGTVASTGQQVFLQIDGAALTNDGTAAVKATIGVGSVLQPDINIVYVVDASNSESLSFGSNVGDVNGDGRPNTRFDAQLAGLINLSQKILQQGFDPAHTQLSIIPFDTIVRPAGANQNSPSQVFQMDAAGVSAAIAYLKQLDYPQADQRNFPGLSGGTNYEDALRGTIRQLNTMDPGRTESNFVYFVSDGDPTMRDRTPGQTPVGIANNNTVTSNAVSSDPATRWGYADEVRTLTVDDTTTAAANDGLNAQISAIGIGSSTLLFLNALDNTGGAQLATSPNDLSAALLGSPVSSASVTGFTITVDGVAVPGVGPSNLVQTPIGLQLNLSLDTLLPFLGETSAVEATVTFTGGTTLTSAIDISGVLPKSFDGALTVQGTAGDDVRYGANGNDTLTGNGGADTLTGKGGADTFVYKAVTDSAPGTFDRITDFKSGTDKIDLSAIDAIPGGVNDAFAFAGEGPGAAGSVSWAEQGGNTIVSVDTTGDAVGDLVIILTGTGIGLTAGDFLL